MGNIISSNSSKKKQDERPLLEDSDKLHLALVFSAYTIAFLSLQHGKILNPLQRLFFLEVDKMNNRESMEWNSRILSSFNASIIAFFGILALYRDRKLLEDPFYYSTKLTQRILLSLLGYILYDLLLVTRYYRVFRDNGAIVHHLLFIFALSIGGVAKVFHGLGLLFTFNELSTPPLNLRWHLTRYQALTKRKIPRIFALLNLVSVFFLAFCLVELL